MFNPLKRAAMLARENADAVQANPHLADVDTTDYAKVAELRRLQALAERTRRVEEARRQADELAARSARFDEAVAQHAAAEVAEKARIGKVGKALEASAKRLGAAAVAAQEALSAAQRAADEHDQAVAEAARELLAAGLPAAYTDGDIVHEFATGATRDGRVLVDGRWWLPVDPDAVALRALYAAARARTGEHRGLGAELRMDPRVRKLEHQSAGVIPALPPAFVPATPEWMVELREARAAIPVGAPVLMSDSTREAIERQRAGEEKAERFRDQRRHQEYAEKRAELVADHGEEYVRELELRLFVDGRPFAEESVSG